MGHCTLTILDTSGTLDNNKKRNSAVVHKGNFKFGASWVLPFDASSVFFLLLVGLGLVKLGGC